MDQGNSPNSFDSQVKRMEEDEGAEENRLEKKDNISVILDWDAIDNSSKDEFDYQLDVPSSSSKISLKGQGKRYAETLQAWKRELVEADLAMLSLEDDPHCSMDMASEDEVINMSEGVTPNRSSSSINWQCMEAGPSHQYFHFGPGSAMQGREVIPKGGHHIAGFQDECRMEDDSTLKRKSQ